jgi:hypothetical protein
VSEEYKPFSGRHRIYQSEEARIFWAQFYKHAIEDFKEQIEELSDYLQLKVKQADWHGVADAAMDIRELEAKINLLKELEAQ